MKRLYEGVTALTAIFLVVVTGLVMLFKTVEHKKKVQHRHRKEEIRDIKEKEKMKIGHHIEKQRQQEKKHAKEREKEYQKEVKEREKEHQRELEKQKEEFDEDLDDLQSDLENSKHINEWYKRQQNESKGFFQ